MRKLLLLEIVSEKAAQIVFVLNTTALNIEYKYGRKTTSIIIGAAMLFCAMLYVWPRKRIIGHGVFYCKLSENPFNFLSDNPLHFRILSPVLGYITGLRGNLFVILPFIFCILFTAVVYSYCRKKKFTPAEGILTASLFSFSSVFLFDISLIGYTDIVSYFFILLCFIYINRKIWVAIFFLLAIFNHESNLFIIVPLILHAIQGKEDLNFKNLALTCASFIVPVLMYFYFRHLVSMQTNVAYNTDYYFSKENLIQPIVTYMNIPLGLFYTFKLFWIFPLLYFIFCLAKKAYIAALVVFSFIFFPFLQLIIAFDISRLMSLCFPVMLLSVEKVRQIIGSDNFSIFTLIIILVNFLIPQYTIMPSGIIPLLPIFIGLPYYYFLKQ